jgi:16S rRNA processing protein RimM
VAESAEALVVLGKVVDAYGLRGWVRIHAFGDDPLEWRRMPVWWLRDAHAGDWQPYELIHCRVQGDDLVASLGGVADRTTAEELKGFLLGAPRAALPATAEGEYYWADLIGLEVINAAGEALGHVDGLIETGAGAVMRVLAGDGRERLLPFVAAVVGVVDHDAGCIRVEWGSDW